MIITIKKGTPQEEIDKIVESFQSKGLSVDLSEGSHYHVIGIVGDTSKINERDMMSNTYVDNVIRIAAPYKKVNRMFHPSDSVIDVSGVKIGEGEKIAVIGGPCSVEGEQSVMEIAAAVKDAGAVMLRGGAYKPRTSPYAFQGMGEEGLQILAKAREVYGLPVVSEIMSADKLDEFEQYVDMAQVGARNMQNFDLLKALGRFSKPVLLKRGLSNTIEEWLMAAEYIVAAGNPNVVLCERGIRTFEKYTRNTLDLSVVPIVKAKSHLPIVIDPSHATGDWRLVESMSLAAVAAGADGLIIEVHNNPQCAWSDGAQCLKPENFKTLIEKGRKIAQVIGRDM